MSVAVETTEPVQQLSLEEFLVYDDGIDGVYELEEGTLVAMAPESYLNQQIAVALLVYLAQRGIPPQCLLMKTEVVVSGTRPTVRIPDLLVLSEEGSRSLSGASRSTVSLEMPPPRLVVEVVSPGKENINRDYRYKMSQYQARGIGEYWIVDPIEEPVTVLVLVEGLYESRVFVGEEVMESPLLQELPGDRSLSTTQILSGGLQSNHL